MANNILLSVIIELAIPLLIIISIIALLIIRKKSPKLWFVLKVKLFRQKQVATNAVKNEEENAKKHKYNTFQEFLQDCPKYQIDDSYIGKIIRNIYVSAGAKFQQFVWIDLNDPSDETAWIRKKGESLIHDGGTYVMPTKSEKKIQYFFKNDMRPIFDQANDIDWKNPDAVAEVVTGLCNTANMNAMRQSATGGDMTKYILITIAASALTVILLLGFMYQYDKANGQTVEMLKLIINQTQQP